MTIDIKKLSGVARNSVKKTFGKQLINEFYYNSLLSDADLLAYFRLEQNANDSSGHGNNGTANNMTYSNSTTRFGYAGVGNGTTGYIALPSLTFGTNLSFLTWAYFTDNTASRIADSMWGPWVQRYLDTANPHKYQISFWYGTGNAFSTTSPSLNTWVHIACVKSGSNNYIYLNASLENTQASTLNADGQNDLFGRADVHDNSTYRMKGNMDDIILFKRALSATEIMSIYAGQIKKYAGKGNVYA